MTAIFLYIAIVISLMQNWLWLTLLLAVAFSLRYGALSLIPVAVLLDAYYGNYYAVPYLSLIAIGWFIGTELLRPKIINVRSL